jgi:hypothetical protein
MRKYALTYELALAIKQKLSPKDRWAAEAFRAWEIVTRALVQDGKRRDTPRRKECVEGVAVNGQVVRT